MYLARYGFITMEARYGGLRLRQVAVEDTFYFSCRTKATTSALVTKIVQSSSKFIDRWAIERCMYLV